MKLEEWLKLGIKNSEKVADNYQYCKYHGYNALLENKYLEYKIKVEMNDGLNWTLEKEYYMHPQKDKKHLSEECAENDINYYKDMFIPVKSLRRVTDEINNSRFFYSNIEAKSINCLDIKNIYVTINLYTNNN